MEKAVTKVINSNPNIRVDNITQRQRDSAMLANRTHWTSTNSVHSYNDLYSTIDVYIKVDKSEYYYLFRYRGTKPDWENIKNRPYSFKMLVIKMATLYTKGTMNMANLKVNLQRI